MNIMGSYALKTLGKNRARTLITIIGVILSAAMVTAVTTFALSMQQNMLEQAYENDGRWQGGFCNISSSLAEEIAEDDGIAESAVMSCIGYTPLNGGSAGKISDSTVVNAVGPEYFELMPVSLTEGRLPENSGEIILTERFASSLGEYYSIGDVYKVSPGTRTEVVSYETADDGTEYQTSDTVFEPGEERTYTIVGFFTCPPEFDYDAYCSFTAYDGTGDDCTVYFQYDSPRNFYDYFDKRAESLPEGASSLTNRSVLIFSGITRHDSFYKVLYGLCAVVIALIMCGSVSLIYNAFAISVSERTKQYGLLASVGATKRQLRSAVLGEAVAVSAVGIPLGLLSGVGGMYVTFLFIGDKILSMYAGETVGDFKTCVNGYSLLIAAAVAFITVIISAWIPSRRAMRVSPIEALRQTKDVNIKPEKRNRGRLTEKLFGYSGVIAYKNFRRNRKRYNITIASLVMSIVLFVSASSMCTYLTDMTSTYINASDYDISYYMDGNDGELFEALSSCEGVQQSVYAEYRYVGVTIDEECINPDYIDYMLHPPYGESRYADKQELLDEMNATLCFVNDEAFANYVESAGLDSKTYTDSQHPVGVACARYDKMDREADRLDSMDVLRVASFTAEASVTVGSKENYDPSTDTYKDAYVHTVGLEVGEVRDSLAVGINGALGSGIIIMYPLSAMDTMGLGTDRESAYCFFTAGDNRKEAFEDMKSLLEGRGLPTSTLNDVRSSQEMERNLITVVRVFSYGFIILISLIAAANVLNTISTSIALRRRELAMLKSVGMTRGGFGRMMRVECLIYGLKSVCIGLPLAIVLDVVLFRVISEGIKVDFYIPVAPLIIAVLSVFAVVFSSMLYAVRRLSGVNTVDSLKDENL